MEGLIATYLIVLLISAVISGYLTRAVAKDKGHNGADWFLGGFFLGPLGLIAAAGLSDRKLRRYIRQIGEKQDAIQKELVGLFMLGENADDDLIWQKILSVLSSDIADKVDRSKSYLNEPLFGGTEFVVNDSKGNCLAIAFRNEGLMNEYQWEVSLD